MINYSLLSVSLHSESTYKAFVGGCISLARRFVMALTKPVNEAFKEKGSSAMRLALIQSTDEKIDGSMVL